MIIKKLLAALGIRKKPIHYKHQLKKSKTKLDSYETTESYIAFNIYHHKTGKCKMLKEIKEEIISVILEYRSIYNERGLLVKKGVLKAKVAEDLNIGIDKVGKIMKKNAKNKK